MVDISDPEEDPKFDTGDFNDEFVITKEINYVHLENYKTKVADFGIKFINIKSNL